MNFMRKVNCSLSRFTTIKIGGVADVVYFPLDEKGIVEVFKEIKKEKKQFFILGGGSNVVINDGRLNNYAVIVTTHLTHYKIMGNEIEAQAGLSGSILSELAANNHLGGLEFFYGMPGSIGGSVFMNARAYDSEIGQLVKEVTVYDYEKEEFKTLSQQECGFDYKTSIFQSKPYLIYKVRLALIPNADKAECWKIMNRNKHDRKEKGHFLFPSAGCAFKNNRQIGIPTGKLLEELGLKGFQIGGVKVSDKHANFLINASGGTFQDYVKMLEEIKKRVKESKGIDLETEVRLLP